MRNILFAPCTEPCTPTTASIVVILLLHFARLSVTVTNPPHPMLYFDYDEVARLRNKTHSSHNHIAEKMILAVKKMMNDKAVYLPPESISDFKGNVNEVYGDNLCVLAMYCLLFPKDREALKMAHVYMDTLAGYQSWEVAAMPHDDLPISHTLVGLATAYDLLYNTLGVEQRKNIFMKIRLTTQRIFERFKISGWGRHHVQTDTFTNCVALLIGALVVRPHDQRATQWVELTTAHLNVSMTLLSLIIDGSLSQGVSYSTYSALSIFTFTFLANRHLGLNYYSNAWMLEYFWFLYGTTLPGYKECTAIADSTGVWLYGPEAHLVFLDSYVIKTGYANWLADRISRARKDNGVLKPSPNQQWATHHLEFIWYNEEIPSQAPYMDTSFFLYSDWGVVTYGGGAPAGQTYLTFKSGVLLGQALHTIVKKGLLKSVVDGWSSFDPQHDHPDQLSFTFWPGGEPFITDAYYGPKMTVLNNALLFGPSTEAKCSIPYEGQLGECYKWFNWNAPGIVNSTTHLLASYEEMDTVFVSGEAVSSYAPHLGLSSVYRSIFLLTPEVLLVVDHVVLRPHSNVTHLNAIFNMRAGLLELESNVAHLLNNGNDYYIQWSVDDASKQQSSTISTNGFEYPCEQQTRETQFVNITVPMSTTVPTRVAYLFYKDTSYVEPPHFSASGEHGVNVTTVIDDIRYNVSIATEHDDPKARLKWLGFPGYGSMVTSSGKWIWYGFEEYEPAYLIVHKEIIINLFNLLFLLLSVFVASLVVVSKSSRAHLINKWIANNLYLMVSIVISMFSILFITFVFMQPQVVSPYSSYSHYSLPRVFISSLKFTGSQLVAGMFDHSPDYLHVKIPSIVVRYPDVEHVFGHFVDPCMWDEDDMDKNTMMSGWLSSIYHNPQKHFSHFNTNDSIIVNEFFETVEQRPDSSLVMATQDGAWNLKLPWVAKAIGPSAKIIYIIRDPRAWVAALLKSKEYKNVVEDLKYTFQHSTCVVDDHYGSLYASVRKQLDFITGGEFWMEGYLKLLAYIWYADTATALINNGNMSLDSYLIMRLEDLILEPELTVKNIFQFISMPVPPLAQHYILQVTRSNQFRLPTGERIGRQSMEWWQDYLNTEQIKVIEEICQPVMDMLGYEPL